MHGRERNAELFLELLGRKLRSLTLAKVLLGDIGVRHGIAITTRMTAKGKLVTVSQGKHDGTLLRAAVVP